jgi:hypothetical protein
VLWTPTVLLLDSNGNERYRIEGYLPRDEFFARLLAGEARIAFMQKRWADAERLYKQVVDRFPNSAAAAEAMYWAGVSHYKATNDHTGLAPLANDLKSKYPESIWTKAASVWAPQPG